MVSLVALQGQQVPNFVPPQTQDGRQGRDLLDWIGLGTGPEQDPYLAKTNAQCLTGDLASCFQSRALASLDDFFNQPAYGLTERARVLRLPEEHLRSLGTENYEYSSSPRSEDSEWDSLVKFGMRKVEKFLKSTAIEVDFDNEVTERGRYSPRFIDEIADEIDVIEDKKDSIFSKKKTIEEAIHSNAPDFENFQAETAAFLTTYFRIGLIQEVVELLCHYYSREQPSFVQPAYHEEYSQGNGFSFRDENAAQNLAYNGWNNGQFRNSGKDIQAEPESTSKKSILPDS
ncbi:unnamed protein product [Ceutorhynchus assimilis]|uniref:Uncharacterized protein n=1 Tax=Ceutorhynchus assimilis TaxID=467358 RepID=A0A9N9MF69_9CUCU|nr:unnamed protein product [Ceutorhynchus assimilis]